MRRSFPFSAVLIMGLLLCFGLGGCQKYLPPLATQKDNLSIGVVPFTQPLTAVDLLAGFIPENQQQLDPDDLARLDLLLEKKLGTVQGRPFTFLTRADLPAAKAEDEHGRRSALATWMKLAEARGFDLLMVPVMLDWREREGGDMGITSPASVNMDIFLIDTRDEEARRLSEEQISPVVQRSHYAVTQQPLTSNLLGLGDFFKRKGQWVTASELCEEGIDKAITDLAL